MEPPSEIDLHRLVWNPDDFDRGFLLGSAFSKEDLMGGARYVSVDRIDHFCAEATLKTAEKQALKANGETIIRKAAASALLPCEAVRGAEDSEGAGPFSVTPEPLEENEAHCGIRNVSGKGGRAYVNQLRVLLVALVRETLGLDEFIERNG